MSKHRESGTPRSVRGLVVAAIAGGLLALPAVPAMAQPITVPGVGTFDVPGVDSARVPAPAPVVTNGQRALDAALSKLGSPYVWGATGPNSFDCSGLVQWAYRQVGVSVPRTTYDQVRSGTSVARDGLLPGDVVLFAGAEHVGLYAGDGMIVHAPTAGQPVKKSPVDSMPFFAARRY
ncbi:C40 family peptidase [Rhodococcus gannanensis]|uniref:C40 family peptidase n=1 Tax=Rhodococcus gannanensis TaxID=1960308 RepID=A0ABW4P520_9NOCA